MKEITARRIAKTIDENYTDKLVDALLDLHENRGQTIEDIEEIADESPNEEGFYLKVADDILLDDISMSDLRELEENLEVID